MGILDRLAALMPGDVAKEMRARWGELAEVRLRAGRPAQLLWTGGEALCGGAVDAERLRRITAAMMDYSLYARESELNQGYFTMDDGSRVGVCGRFARDKEGWRLTEIGSVCVRVARPVSGCADAVMEAVDGKGGLKSTLILSRPGMGKTTLLRDIARQLSGAGRRVGLVDERHEMAACMRGVPTLDVGPRTDVMDGCPKPLAITTLIRAMAPEVIVADEIGGEGDARALADAARCGVAVVASAHAGDIGQAMARPMLRAALLEGAFQTAVLLGSRPGSIREICPMGGGGAAWKYA